MMVNSVPVMHRFLRESLRHGRGLLAILCLLFGGILQAQQNGQRNSVSNTIEPAIPTYRLYDDGSVKRDLDAERGTPETAMASRIDFPPVLPEGRHVVGLALQGGGALGLAHIGILQWLEDHHVPVDRIAGTSMGCLIGALEASAHTPQEMKAMATNGDVLKVFALQAPYTDLSFRRKQDRIQMSQAITLGLRHGVSFRNALLVDEGLNDFLSVSLSSYEGENLKFDSLPTPLRCVATDLNTLRPVVFREGSLPLAVRASISIPGVFPPLNYQDHFLVDGATMNNLPSDIVRKDLHADVVIAVHLEGSPLAEGDVASIVGVLTCVYSAAIAQTERAGIANADLVVNVKTCNFSTTDYAKGRELIAAGYRSAEENRAKLEVYALSDIDWAKYEADRLSRKPSAAGLLQVLKVEGGTEAVQQAVHRDLQSLHDQPISSSALVSGLKRVQADGG